MRCRRAKTRDNMLEVNMTSDKKIVISKKSNLKGEDGYKTFSIRIKESTIDQLDEIAKRSNRSRNGLINLVLEFAVANCEIED